MDEDEVGGLEVRVDNVVFVDCADAFKHFFPVIAGEAEVQLSIDAVELEPDDAREVRFTKLHELEQFSICSNSMQ